MAKQDGAVEVKEPLEERSEALEEENPKVVAEILVEIRNPGAEICYWIDCQTLRAEKFNESNIELFEAIYEAGERVDEEANEIIVIDSITETIIDKIAGRVVAGGDKIAEK